MGNFFHDVASSPFTPITALNPVIGGAGALPLADAAAGNRFSNMLGSGGAGGPTPWDITMPYYQQVYGNVFGQGGAYGQPVNPALQQSWTGTQQLAGQSFNNGQYVGDPGINAANQFNQGVISGQNQAQAGQIGPVDTSYLGQTAQGGMYQNPYLNDMYKQAAQSVTDQYTQNALPAADTTAMQAGRYGSNAWSNQRDMANKQYMTGLNNLATNLYGGAYEGERGRQYGAQTYLTGLGNQNQTNQAGLNTQTNQFNFAQQMNAAGTAPAMYGAQFQPLQYLGQAGQAQGQCPWTQAQNAVNLLGGTGSQQIPDEPNKPNFIQGMIGGAAAGAPFGPWGAGIGAGLGGFSTMFK